MISIGDTVTAKPYLTGVGLCHHFTGTAKVVASTPEPRRSLSDNRVRQYTRITVICETRQSYGFQRRDVLSDLLDRVVMQVARPAWNTLRPVMMTRFPRKAGILKVRAA